MFVCSTARRSGSASPRWRLAMVPPHMCASCGCVACCNRRMLQSSHVAIVARCNRRLLQRRLMQRRLMQRRLMQRRMVPASIVFCGLGVALLLTPGCRAALQRRSTRTCAASSTRTRPSPARPQVHSAHSAHNATRCITMQHNASLCNTTLHATSCTRHTVNVVRATAIIRGVGRHARRLVATFVPHAMLHRTKMRSIGIATVYTGSAKGLYI